MLTGRAGQFGVDVHEDGQLYVRGDDPEARLDAIVAADAATIQVEADRIIEIEKLYGPLIFASIRVRADDWIIERDCGSGEGEWREAARILDQLAEDFA